MVPFPSPRWSRSPPRAQPPPTSPFGRYILQPEIFSILETQERGAGNEIQLTDGMLKLAKAQEFFGVTFKGEVHDTGSKMGFLMANLAYGLASDETGAEFRKLARAYLAQQG